MKSGFYYLSKLTKTPIYVVHLNYIDNKIEVIDRFFILEQPFDEVKINVYQYTNHLIKFRFGLIYRLWRCVYDSIIFYHKFE